MTAEESSTLDRATPAWWPAFVIAAAFAICLAMIGYATHGKPLAEKTLTACMMPIGLFWVVLTGRLLHLLARHAKRGVWPLMLLWLAFTTLGTRPFPRLLIRSIESSVSSYRPERDGPLDTIVVLGGGTTQGDWRPQVSGAGDRVVMAAELYHLGMTRQLITTGEATAGVSGDTTNPSDQTRQIWTKLRVAPEHMRRIGGRNTFEEMQQLKQIWPELPGKRVGLLTSALHLPRAMRLARAQGLELTPIAADLRAAVEDWGLLSFIPNADNFGDMARVQHEIMARLVSR